MKWLSNYSGMSKVMFWLEKLDLVNVVCSLRHRKKIKGILAFSIVFKGVVLGRVRVKNLMKILLEAVAELPLSLATPKFPSVRASSAETASKTEIKSMEEFIFFPLNLHFFDISVTHNRVLPFFFSLPFLCKSIPHFFPSF